MTREQAFKLAETGFWKELNHRERAMFQLFERRLCMPFDVFHEAVEKTLGRPVWTHEFGEQGTELLKKEMLGESPAPTFEEILNLIPKDKQVVVVGA